ncbi:MAG: radical SAM protein [Desulfobacteraceae bacterium]|nr:radical SAM protein [Desulfobacteraceae bacterium]
MTQPVEDIIEEYPQKGYISLVIPPHPPDWSNFIWNNSEKVIYGPVDSRRLGKSLGINLFPGQKICNYNCVYCDCGSTDLSTAVFVPESELRKGIEQGLLAAKNAGIDFDFLTFAGNGEPTLHPAFFELAEFAQSLLLKHYNRSNLAIFTNGTLLSDPRVRSALERFLERVYVKLDAATKQLFKRISRPNNSVLSFGKMLESFRDLEGYILSSCILENGKYQLNTYKSRDFVEILSEIAPKELNIYAIEYPTLAGAARKKSVLTYSQIQEIMDVAFYLSQHVDIPIKIFLRRNSCEE